MTDLVAFDVLVRTTTVVLALGLFVISLLAYRRNRRKIMLFVSFAFLSYFARGLINLINPLVNVEVSILSISFSDFLDFLTLGLIFFAVVKE